MEPSVRKPVSSSNDDGTFNLDKALSAECLKLGEEALRQRKYLSAESCSIAAISARPDNHDAYHLLGRVLEMKGQADEAVVCYRGLLPDYLIERLGLSMRCLLYTSPSPRDQRGSRMPSSA